MLEKVRVRRENVIGNPGDGDRLAADTLNIGRVGIASQMVGLAQSPWRLPWITPNGGNNSAVRSPLFRGFNFHWTAYRVGNIKYRRSDK